MAFEIHYGTNISGWLSQSKRRGAERRAYFTQDVVQRLASMGGGKLDHLRIPIDEEQMWDEAGNREPEAFELLDAALDWCEAAGLRAVVDLHLLRTHHFLDKENPPLFADPAEADRFANLWLELSEFLDARTTDQVAYELMNEPVARDPEDWNRVAMAAYRAIREREPARTVVLGSNWFNQVQTFDQLRVPEDDKLILTFHYYKPMFITHYTARWWDVGGTYDGPVHYPGKPLAAEDVAKLDPAFLRRMEEEQWNRYFDRDVIVEDLAQPLGVAERTGLPLYCGEFGTYDRASVDLRLAWLRDVLAVFEAYNIAWANWSFKGSFGLIDNDGNKTAIAGVLLS